MNRRRLLIGLTTLIASPTIVRASSLMTVVPLPETRTIPVTLELTNWRSYGYLTIDVETLPDGTIDFKVGDIIWGQRPASESWECFEPKDRDLLRRLGFSGAVRTGHREGDIADAGPHTVDEDGRVHERDSIANGRAVPGGLLTRRDSEDAQLPVIGEPDGRVRDTVSDIG